MHGKLKKLIALAVSAGLVAMSLVMPAHAAEKTIKVGAALPLTGPLSPEGNHQRNGYQMWADTVNAAGGIKAGGDTYKVEMVYVDYQSNTPRAVQSAERLITQDKVDFLFAPFGSGATKAVSAITEKYGVPLIAPNAASEQVYDQGFKYLFGVYSPNHTLTDPVVELITKQHPTVKKVAILSRNDLFPTAISDELQKSAKARGMDVVYYEKFAIGTVDYSAAFTKLRSTNPDWIFFAGYTNDLILARKQMAEQGVSGKLLTMVVGAAEVNFRNAVSADLVDGVTTFAWWDAAAGYQGKDIFGTPDRFAQLYQAKHNEYPGYPAAGSAACGVVLQLGIEKAGSVDKAKVRDAIASLDVMTFWGPIKFGPTGQISSLKPPMLQMQGGKVVVVHPAEIKRGDLRLGFK
ncbi:amino acid ABC transporter substrate-binding protein [Variovorax sp. VNK109]|uniref:amino acid ABC transporter substrate-binding protein n=1 Tax=Variovorax sp. VNK109 TaxID=3400919 RepID=UPI003C0C7B82